MATIAAKAIYIGGLKIDALSQEAWAELLVENYKANPGRSQLPKFMTSANGFVLSLQARSPAFRRLLDHADGIDADGMPLVLASRWLSGESLPGRVATTDFFHVAAGRAAEAGMSFYLLGGSEEDNRTAVERVRAAYPGLRIAGRRNGYFARGEEAAITDEIVAAGTDVLWVGLGVPLEHDFIVRNRRRLTGVTWIKTCGGLFKFLSGRDPRAPRWMQGLGLEWLFRLAREPGRLFTRYAYTNCHAIYLMYKHRSPARAVRPSALPGEQATRAS
ncbi:MAG TPA: WecB/TagA/CpsF family glycosyltransferase [Geminicoccaceae bacterium]|nr:WecB/TagA/CpsF family glycosyltransferase [Geminicoccus sp.]HMU51638.1 WecB/TagA/CpsF family glycosyltransferase [Geminicoccaceae bacterium]